LAREGHVLYIVAGPHGHGGEGKLGRREEIGRNRKITVPRSLWKVILVLPSEDAEPRKNSRVIAVVMPNDQTVGQDWTRYRTTARAIEKLTGFRFFQAGVPDEIAEELRDHLDDVKVGMPRSRKR
jgi:endonuclease G